MDSHSQVQLLRPELYACHTVSSGPPKKRAGRTKFRETRHPVYKGVRKRGSNGKRWVCEVRDPSNKSRIWLGTFHTAEMAARAHDVAAMALRGRKACLNFADSAWRLVVPDSANHKDIQQAAAAAAEMFRPSAAAAFDIADEELSPSSETLESSQSIAERISSTTTAPVTAVSSTSDNNVDAEMCTTPSSESDVNADQEQSSSSESDAEKVSSMTTPPPPIAVELCSLLDSTEFGGEYYWDTVLTEPFALTASYCWDDGTSDYVADVSLWSFST